MATVLAALVLCHCGGDPEGVANSSGGDAGGGRVNDGCPTGRGKMVRVDIEGELPFCIDATETTVADYQAFLAANLPTAQTSYDFCSANAAYAPADSCLAEHGPCTGPECERLPQTCVDACDALDYCRWAGKELCGSMEGGIEFVGETTKSSRSVAACTASARFATTSREYPYGAAYDPAACNDRSGSLRPVGQQPACRTVESSDLLDLVGNVWEITATFERGAFDELGPWAVGGDYIDFVPDTCATPLVLNTLSSAFSNVGLRCCAAPAP